MNILTRTYGLTLLIQRQNLLTNWYKQIYKTYELTILGRKVVGLPCNYLRQCTMIQQVYSSFIWYMTSKIK